MVRGDIKDINQIYNIENEYKIDHDYDFICKIPLRCFTAGWRNTKPYKINLNILYVILH